MSEKQQDIELLKQLLAKEEAKQQSPQSSTQVDRSLVSMLRKNYGHLQPGQLTIITESKFKDMIKGGDKK